MDRLAGKPNGLPSFDDHFQQLRNRADTRIAGEADERSRLDGSQTTGVDAVTSRNRVEPTRRRDRVDDAQSTDNERTDSLGNEPARTDRAKKSKKASDDAEPTVDSECTSSDAAPDEESADTAATADAIVAAVMTMPTPTDVQAPVEVAAVDAVAKPAEAEDVDPAVLAVMSTAYQPVTLDESTADAELAVEANAGAASAIDALDGLAPAAQSKTADTVTGAASDAAALAEKGKLPTAGDAMNGGGGGATPQNPGERQAATDAKPQSDARPPVAVAQLPQQTEAATGSVEKPSAPAALPTHSPVDSTLSRFTALVDAGQPATSAAVDSKAATALAPEQQFARDNLDKLVTGVRMQATTFAEGKAAGNQMHIRLDPPELGALEVAVKMIDGRMSASFTTSNEGATHLLSQNLHQLKSTLEASGIQVDRIQVRQASSGESTSSSNNNNDSRSSDGGRSSMHQDANAQHNNQQRREAVERMWRRFAYGSDDLDLVA